MLLAIARQQIIQQSAAYYVRIISNGLIPLLLRENLFTLFIPSLLYMLHTRLKLWGFFFLRWGIYFRNFWNFWVDADVAVEMFKSANLSPEFQGSLKTLENYELIDRE